MRKMYLVPNFVTTANLFCGYFAVLKAAEGAFVTAAWALLLANVFDSLDGRIARLAKATSAFGVEYDSLCDLVSFGLAPACMLYHWSLHAYGRLGFAISFLFCASGALRLARFNVTPEESEKSGAFFQGLPIPGAATVVTSLILFLDACDSLESVPAYVVLVLSLFLSLLMVSTLPFHSFKELNWRSRASLSVLLLGIIYFTALFLRPEWVMFPTVALYVCLSPIFGLFQRRKQALT